MTVLTYSIIVLTRNIIVLIRQGVNGSAADTKAALVPLNYSSCFLPLGLRLRV